MEPPREQEKKATEHLAKRDGKRNKGDGYTRREDGHKQTTALGIPWSMAYTPSEQTGISKEVCNVLLGVGIGTFLSLENKLCEI